MRRFVNLNCLIESNDAPIFPIDAIQNLRQAVLAPIKYKPNIEQTLQRANFKFHRTCSYSSLIRECNVTEGQTLLIFWGSRSSDSRVTISMSASSCSSVHIPPSAHNHGTQRDKDLRTTAQQTDISCRYSPGVSSPVLANLSDIQDSQVLRERIADSLTFSSPASSILQPTARSMSILGSVCALLLKKQGSDAKEVSSVTASIRSDNICRICFGGSSAERLVRPCSCRGTIAAVHRSCLERWLLQAATSHCELCRHHYVVTRSHKWSWARSVVEWARSGRGRALAADAWRGAALGAASVLGTARALHACDAALQVGARRGGGAALAANLFSSLLIGVIGALNGLLTTWMLLKIQEHQMSWRTWRDSTLHVHVSLAEPTPTPTPSASSLATVVGATDVTTERATNVADPFMVALPFGFADP
ncbi:E3 ubiquitin-protein ligase MARCHF3-like isoform X1 [Colias croceus]|uniref:E3 ubiquitin-protein ligase MARCHF3-like isoform X1 n=1 Tax=Colias crocea TaxID=72248 RepID=UPI001E27E6B9|nr:E3 ubiquitin-protein ligase MARCHF3-like isoform X1 [Colias croceus]